MSRPPAPILIATRSSNSASASSNTTRQTGRIYKVLGSWEWLEDPGLPIPAEITKITGVTDEMVAGRTGSPVDPDQDDPHAVAACRSMFRRSPSAQVRGKGPRGFRAAGRKHGLGNRGRSRSGGIESA